MVLAKSFRFLSTLLLVLLAVRPAFGEETERFAPPAFSGIAPSLLQSISSGAVFRPFPDAVAPAELVRPWPGNPLTLSSRVYDMRIKFERPQNGDRPAADFYLFLERGEQGVEMRSNRTGLRVPGPAVVVRYGQRREMPLRVVEEVAQVTADIAAFQADESYGALLCFTESEVVGEEQLESAADAGFKPTEVQFRIAAQLSAEIRGVTGFSTVEGWMRSSSALPEDVEGHDKVTTRAPSVELTYRAKGYSEIDPLLTFPIETSFAQGIQMEALLTNPVGYQRQSSAQRVLYVAPLEAPARAPTEAESAPSAPKQCTAILAFHDMNDQYRRLPRPAK